MSSSAVESYVTRSPKTWHDPLTRFVPIGDGTIIGAVTAVTNIKHTATVLADVVDRSCENGKDTLGAVWVMSKAAVTGRAVFSQLPGIARDVPLSLL